MKLRRNELYKLIESFIFEDDQEVDSENSDNQKIEIGPKEFTVATTKETFKFIISVNDQEGVVVDKESEDGGSAERLFTINLDDSESESEMKQKNHKLSNILAGIGKATIKIKDKSEQSQKKKDLQEIIDAIKSNLDSFSLSDQTFRTHFVNFESEFGLLKSST